MLFYGLDPLYLMMLGPALLLSLLASMLVKSRFARYSKVSTSRGLSGAEAARLLLDANGLLNVRIETAQGFLADHYDPGCRVLRLSPDVYSGRTIASVGIAAHEAGHALQHAERYGPLALRSMLVPVANLGSNLAWILIFAGMLLGYLGLAKIGLVLFAGMVVFTLVTLPVELDASKRAKIMLASHGVTTEAESAGVSKVLSAAAMTYVAAAVTAVVQLLYFAIRLGLVGGSDD